LALPGPGGKRRDQTSLGGSRFWLKGWQDHPKTGRNEDCLWGSEKKIRKVLRQRTLPGASFTMRFAASQIRGASCDSRGEIAVESVAE
jgi:hypothetical protein